MRTERSAEITIPEGDPVDLISALVQTRDWKLKPGEKRDLLVQFGRDFYPLSIMAESYEEVHTPLGTYNTLVLAPRMEKDPKGMFKKGGEVKVWISQDASSLPVKMQLKLGVVTATLQLQVRADNHQGGGRQLKPPGLFRPNRAGIIHADARTRLDVARRNHDPCIHQMQTGLGSRRETIQLPVNPQPPRQTTRAGDAMHAADQHCGRITGRPDHEVEHLVDTVAEIDIPNAARLIHDIRPFGPAFARVACQILFAVVSFHLRDEVHFAVVAQSTD